MIQNFNESETRKNDLLKTIIPVIAKETYLPIAVPDTHSTVFIEP